MSNKLLIQLTFSLKLFVAVNKRYLELADLCKRGSTCLRFACHLACGATASLDKR